MSDEAKKSLDPVLKTVISIVAAVAVYFITQGSRALNAHLRGVDITLATLTQQVQVATESIGELKESSKEEARVLSAALQRLEDGIVANRAEYTAKLQALELRVSGIDQWIVRNNDNHTDIQSELRRMKDEINEIRKTVKEPDG